MEKVDFDLFSPIYHTLSNDFLGLAGGSSVVSLAVILCEKPCI